MTDHSTPTDDDLSLAHDGEADAELLARIEASPEAQARLEQLRAASRLVGNAPVPPLADGTVDELIATALDTPVAPARRTSTTSRRRGAAPWLVAASVVLLMAVGLSLVWAGRSSDDDQASATKASESADGIEAAGGGSVADSASPSAEERTAAGMVPGGHGAPTTTAAATGSQAVPPIVYLGTYPSGDRLRAATASSFTEALDASGSPLEFGDPDPGAGGEEINRTMPAPPAQTAVDRCAEQLQITLSLEAGPLQTGYAVVDDTDVLVYEFATTSARDAKETTLVAAVGADACDEVVLFER